MILCSSRRNDICMNDETPISRGRLKPIISSPIHGSTVSIEGRFCRRILDELRALSKIHESLTTRPQFHTHLIHLSNKYRVNYSDKDNDTFWLKRNTDWYKSVISTINIGGGSRPPETIQKMFQYLNKKRKCDFCQIKYTIRDTLGKYTCLRNVNEEFGQEFIKRILTMHTDNLTTERGILKVPFYAFILFRARIPDCLNSVGNVVLVPIQNETKVSLFDSYVEIFTSAEI